MSKRATLEELAVLLKDAEARTPVGSEWKHYKGTVYTLTGHAIIESDSSVAVLYRNPEGIVFSRPLSEFTETVGTQKRFQKIS
ncbi:MAG: DUF1653 domain-containing protein [Patescibacteria group bacterium]